MKFLSLFSGIDAASVAWNPLGWEAVGFSEIEPFPSEVLNHHYPHIKNYGDVTKYQQWSVSPFQLLVGGSPCQSFSVAGLRQGLADPRGNLMLTYLGVIDKFKPKWIVFENVPGLLSSNGGKDFGTLLGSLGELGYGFAYRVLDAQYFGVPQRRRRVFVVGYLGDWRPAAAVLFDPFSLSGHPAPSRKARQEVAGGVKAGAANGSEQVGALMARDYKDATDLVTQPVTYDMQQVTAPVNKQSRKPGDPCHTLSSDNAGNAALVQPMATDLYNGAIDGDVTHSLRVGNGNAMGGVPSVMASMQVRRLTPIECERLQGFPDGYTAIPWKNKPAEQCPDGPRYKALGNSMAVPVMRWIGERIQAVEDMMKELGR
jgi:DNA (cytosine-5)-methyltransferase 1